MDYLSNPRHGMHRVKNHKKILSSKTQWEPKTVVLSELQAMNALPTGYNLLCLIPTPLMGIWRGILYSIKGVWHLMYMSYAKVIENTIENMYVR